MSFVASTARASRPIRRFRLCKGSVRFFGIDVYNTQIVVIAGALVMMIALFAVVQRTKIGKAMRAVSEDKEAAALMGIDVDRVIVFTFALGGASAGVAGILYIILFPIAWFFMGFIPALKAFTAAVLGGIGNVAGAFLGAMVLGLARIDRTQSVPGRVGASPRRHS